MKIYCETLLPGFKEETKIRKQKVGLRPKETINEIQKVFINAREFQTVAYKPCTVCGAKDKIVILEFLCDVPNYWKEFKNIAELQNFMQANDVKLIVEDDGRAWFIKI